MDDARLANAPHVFGYNAELSKFDRLRGPWRAFRGKVPIPGHELNAAVVTKNAEQFWWLCRCAGGAQRQAHMDTVVAKLGGAR